MLIEIEDRVPKAGRRPIISDNADLVLEANYNQSDYE